MGMQVEPVNEGLVTSRDASTLSAGELQRCENLHYRPNSPSLWKIPGSSLVADTGSSSVSGLAYCGFDDADDRLVAQVGTEYKAINLTTAAVSTLETITPGTTLVSVHHTDSHHLLNGANRNQVLMNDGTTRRHGLAPVTSKVGLALLAGGAWDTVLAPLPNTYDYWATEVWKTDDWELESTYEGLTAYIAVTSGNYVQITLPPWTNTHVPAAERFWRVYRGQPRVNAKISRFPEGNLVSEVSGTDNTVNDGLSTTGSYAPAGTVTIVTTKPSWGNSEWTLQGWSGSTNLASSNNSYATATINNRADCSILALSSFGWTATTYGNPIVSIEVSVEGQRNNNKSILFCALSGDNGASVTDWALIPVIEGSTDYTYSVSGTWGRTWTPGELADGSFIVYLFALCTSSGSTTQIHLDHVQVRVTSGGQFETFGITFPALTIAVSDTAPSSIGAHGDPPIASTGDVFQGSLVTNDIEVPTAIAYSLADQPDYFPALYRMAFDTASKDRVTNITSLNNMLMIGLAGQVWRVNYLPRETDAEFAAGRVQDLVDPFYGVVGPKAACKLTIGGELIMAYVSASELRYTNGVSSGTLVTDVNIRDYVDESQLNLIELTNNPRYSELVLKYPVGGGFKTLRFSYHKTHMKETGLKCSGPHDETATSWALGVSPVGEQLLYAGYSDGSVYKMNVGVANARPLLKTREMYSAGPGNEWTYDELWVHHGASGDTLTSFLDIVSTNLNPRTSATQTIQTPSRGLSHMSWREQGEGIATTIQGTTSTYGLTVDYLVLKGTSLGQSDSFQ